MSSDAAFQAINLFTEITKPWTVKPDWDKTAKLIDLVNSDPGRVTLVLLTKLFEQLSDKDSKVVWLSLIVLDACVKHCSQEFIRSVAVPDYMHKLYVIVKKRWVKKSKGVSAKNTYNNWCGQIAASMIQEWGLAFSNNSRYNFPLFTETYRKCVQKGVAFPPPHMTASMPRFISKDGKKVTGSDMLRNSVKVGSEVGISAEIRKIVDSAISSSNLLNEIINTSGVTGSTDEVVTQIVIEVEKIYDEISKLVPLNLENEKALALLLSAHDKIEKALQNFRQIPHREEESDDQSSEEVAETESVDGEKFQREFIQKKLQDFGNPFNNFLIAHNTDKSPHISSSGITGSQSHYDPITFNKSVINTNPNIHNSNQPFNSPFTAQNPFAGSSTALPFTSNTSPPPTIFPANGNPTTSSPFTNISPPSNNPFPANTNSLPHINISNPSIFSNLTTPPYNPFANPHPMNSGFGGSVNPFTNLPQANLTAQTHPNQPIPIFNPQQPQPYQPQPYQPQQQLFQPGQQLAHPQITQSNPQPNTGVFVHSNPFL